MILRGSVWGHPFHQYFGPQLVDNAAFIQEPILGLSWEPWQDVDATQSFTFQLTSW